MLTLSEIKVKVNELALKIGAPQNILPTKNTPADPVHDDGSLRVVYWKSLRDQWHSVAQANKMAHEKYPYPKEPRG